MARPRAQLALSLVAFLLGLLVVAQIRATTIGAGLGARSAQELTVLVANLNTRNDQLRTEIARLERELGSLLTARARGETSVDQLRSDLARIRAWAGLDPVTGPGIRITVEGPIAGIGVEDLLNELRNGGAEAIGVGGVRVVPGVVVTGEPGALTVGGRRLRDPFEIDAIGRPETLTGSLTRVGGIIAQLAATYPEATVTVTPLERLEVPATDRPLVPRHGRPRL